MSLMRLDGPEGIAGALPGGARVVVVVPVFEAYDDVVQCVSSLLSHTAEDIPLLLIDDGSVEPRFRQLSFDTDHTVLVCHMRENSGFVVTANTAFSVTGRADVVIVNSDVIVGPGWLEGLTAAAYTSSTVATATPITNHGTMLSVGHGRNSQTRRLPDGVLADQAAERVALRSPKLTPVIPTAIGHCTYFRRLALDTVGLFDEAFAPGYGEEVDFSQRAIAHGFVHVCADDVFVFHKGGSSFGRSEAVKELIAAHDRLIRRRYPYYLDWVRREAASNHSALAASLLAAEVALRGMRLIVDGWCLGPTTMGSQTVVLESVSALAKHPDVGAITVVVPRSIASTSMAALNKSGVHVVVGRGPGEALPEAVSGDLVYRPYQVTNMAELEWLRRVAPRMVVNQLDCIAYNDPAYFEDEGQWCTYRRVNELTSYVADGLVFLSRASLDQARSSGLLSASVVTEVVYAGTAEPLGAEVNASPPPGMPRDARGFLLCLGASYLHKNRPLALKIWAAARKAGWEGDLVLAGPTPPYGNSLAAEDEFLLQNPALRAHLWRLGALTDQEKAWLYQRASLVLYPSSAEGFGLVPFEAVANGVPCLTSRAGSLDEVLPKDLPTIDPGDIDAAAALAVQMAQPGALREQVCSSLLLRSAEFTWERTGQLLIDCFWRTLGRQSFEPALTAGLFATPGIRVGREVASRNYSVVHRPIAWAVRQVADHSELRQYLIPPGSQRLKAGIKLVSFLEGRSR